MPVRRDSSNGGGVKVGRKPRVAVGSSKRSGDGVRAPRSKNNDDGEGHRKTRVGRDGLEGSSGAVRRLEEAKKRGMIRKVERSGNVDDGVTEGHRKTRVARDGLEGSSGAIRRLEEAKKRGVIRKVERSGNVDDGVTYRDVNGKSRDTNGRRKRDSDMKSGSEGFESVRDGKSDRKRKRIGDELRIDNDMKPRRKTDYELKDSRRKTSMMESGKFRVNKSLQNGKIMGAETSRNAGFRGSRSLDKKVWTGKTNRADKPKHFGLGNGRSKISDKSNSVISSDKPRYRKGIGKKNLVADSDLTEFLPKKKKRGIRIDPYDTSNKRLDDDISNKGDNQVNIDKTESSGLEMSKNAQFRAIRPSPSIISFVEENLLGRRREIEFRRAGYNIELPAPLDNIPFSTNTERERTEVPAFRNKLEFYAAAKVSSSFPPPELPEIAFAGRSNVGKSSLLNALTRQWGVVQTSDKPGLTQSINFFKLGPKLSLVDLPGYGFAYAKDEVKEAWEELVKEYVSTRVGLKRVCLLVDTKWGMKPRDLELIDLMERSETKYQIVLTKTDTVFPVDVARRAMQIEENLKAKKSAVQPLMMVSSKTGAGIRSLRTVLANVARFVKR